MRGREAGGDEEEEGEVRQLYRKAKHKNKKKSSEGNGMRLQRQDNRGRKTTDLVTWNSLKTRPMKVKADRESVKETRRDEGQIHGLDFKITETRTKNLQTARLAK